MYTLYAYMYFKCSITYVPSLPCLCFLHFTGPEASKQFTRLVTDNAENLMNAVSKVLNATENAFMKLPSDVHTHLTGLNWVKK